MELTTDVLLRGTAWNKAIDELSPIFKATTNYSIYLLCVSIGIMYDRRIAKPEENGEEVRTVPRTVMQNYDKGRMEFMFQAAILSTTTENFTEDERLELAFSDKKQAFNKLSFLTQFANFGVTKLVEQIGSTTIETMENIKIFLSSMVEGQNFDIDILPDDIFLSEEL